ncbi:MULTISPECIES: dienelactone hydrolase family protein [unclassified Sphingobium]|uniref:dienelactone hydrolase family protein n=1 Tax=unclassified Sphingobium TaxID=2611147 RepID=UPI0022257D0E|nr:MULTISPECIES: hypothetical protein [unclassified Sphingobium]MCW2395925.1 dienelactone hydrolase [Sphingobium sp. B8D3B]MCW2419441.1 dienelactone hydrolase [Sphingobium sp. B8D3C]
MSGKLSLNISLKSLGPRIGGYALIAVAAAGLNWTAPLIAAPAGAAPVESVRLLPRTGPFKVTMEMVPSLPNHVIYRPEGVKGRMPIVAWGNGGCAAVGNRYRRFLTDIASRGFLVIAVGQIGDARYETDHDAEPYMPTGPIDFNAPGPSESVELSRAIDWAAAESQRRGSAYFKRVDTRHVAVMGHSCGGLQALAVTVADPRVTTAVILNSGVWSTGPGGLPGARVTKADLARVKVPIAYFSGDPSDGAHANSKDDFSRLRSVPAVWAYRSGVGHTAQYWGAQDEDEYSRVTAAWLQWQLQGDQKAAQVFRGADCTLCSDSKWTLARHDIP